MRGCYMYEKTCIFLFEKISQRTSALKRYYGLSNEEIYDINPAIASRIVNYYKTHILTNNNPYLVPCRTVDGENRSAYIASCLHFHSVSDFLWGNPFEIKMYEKKLLFLLLNDALSIDSNLKDIDKEVIECALCLHPEYALIHALEVVDKNEYYRFSLKIPRDIEYDIKCYKEAVSRLNDSLNFGNLFIEYFKNRTTLRIEDSIDAFVHDTLLLRLKEIHEESNVISKNLFETYKYLINIMPSEVDNVLPEYRYNVYLESGESMGDVYDDISNSTEEFINAAVKTIHRLDKREYSEDDVINDWEEDEYLKTIINDK